MTEDYTLREAVFRTFLQNPNLGPSEMTEKLEANYNSVKAVYAKLHEEGLLLREGRGSYAPNYAGILLNMLDRLEALEKASK
jgi:DNA-binding transcriptional regulator YhcF (GntR family)